MALSPQDVCLADNGFSNIDDALILPHRGLAHQSGGIAFGPGLSSVYRPTPVSGPSCPCAGSAAASTVSNSNVGRNAIDAAILGGCRNAAHDRSAARGPGNGLKKTPRERGYLVACLLAVEEQLF